MEIASRNVRAILTEVFNRTSSEGENVLLVYDEQSPLSKILSAAYREALPNADFLNFDLSDAEKIKKRIDLLTPGGLVILVQSTNFRLDAFRIRVHLFERGLQAIEHPHLGRVCDEEIPIYIDALSYDAAYYQRVAPNLKNQLDQAKEVRLEGGGETLIYDGALEPAKLNIGDYREMKNKGGQFPIGEVFTELVDLTRLNGKIPLFAFGDRNFSVSDCDPLLVLEIRAGRLVDVFPKIPEFETILDDIRTHEGEIWVRELGFGLNRAMTRTRRIHEVGMYERMCGVHLSLGAKHALYPKSGFSKKTARYHLDVFPAVDRATVDGKIVYENGTYVV